MISADQCPQCEEPLTRVGKHWICPEHGQISPGSSRRESAHTSTATPSPLRIFLSYGHDANEELVARIKVDLDKRGHDVWFDQNEIKAGDDWRRSITEGITGSHKFVSFLSKHSTRDPGVCLDEIGIAIGVKEGNIQTILVESEHEVQLPPGIGTTQWLDMHDWKERRTADQAEWENWYQKKLSEIVRVVESDESRRFAGEIETLKNHLKPIKSDSRIYELLKKGLTGRKWIFEAIEKWRNGRACHSVRADSEKETPPSPCSEGPGEGLPKAASQGGPSGTDSRVFWLMGDPGVGKSAIAAHLAIHGRNVIAVEFCNWQQPGHKNPERIVRTLAFQISTRLPDYRKLLLTKPEIDKLDNKNADELFDYLLTNPLKHAIDGERERYLMVIDALDEAGEGESNPLVNMLASSMSKLPDWIGLVVTSRPESEVTTPLQGLNPFPFHTSSEKNLADIRDYLRHELASKLEGRADADRLVEQIREKSEGVFLYAERFCDDVQRGHLSLDHPQQFPQGLGGIFFQYFQRQFPDLEKFRKDVRPVLRAILAAREPLPVEILQRLFHWQDEELRDFTRTLGSLFPVTKEANGEVIKSFHKSLNDWLVDGAKAGEYFVVVQEGHSLLADVGWHPTRGFSLTAEAYFNRQLPYHITATGQWDRLKELLFDKQLDLFQRWIERGELETGRFCLHSYIRYLRDAGDETSYQYALTSQLARLEVRAGNLLEAETLLHEALVELKEFEQPALFAIAAHERGSICFELGNNKEARIWYRRALRSARCQRPPSNGEIAANLVALATTYQVAQLFPRRVECLAKYAILSARMANDKPHEVEGLRVLSDVCKDALNYEKAEDYLSLGLAEARRHALPFAEMALLAVQGWMRYQKAALHFGSINEAVDAFEQLALLARPLRHNRFFADALTGKGQCSLLANDADGVAKAIRKLRDVERGCVFDHTRVRCFMLEAGSLHQQGDLSAAAEIYLKALDAAISNRLLQRQADAHVGYGATLWHLGKRAGARRQWFMAITAARKCTTVRAKLVAESIRRARRDSTSTPL